MFDGRDKQQWWHTANLAAAVINCQRDAKSRAVHPKQLHPYYAAKAHKGMAMKGNMGAAVGMFVAPEKQKAAIARAAAEKALADQITARLKAERKRT